MFQRRSIVSLFLVIIILLLPSCQKKDNSSQVYQGNTADDAGLSNNQSSDDFANLSIENVTQESYQAWLQTIDVPTTDWIEPAVAKSDEVANKSNELLDKAQDLIAVKCMQKSGFPDYKIDDKEVKKTDYYFKDNEVGFVSLKFAQKWGYNIVESGGTHYIDHGKVKLKPEVETVGKKNSEEKVATKEEEMFFKKGGCQDQGFDLYWSIIPKEVDSMKAGSEKSRILDDAIKNNKDNPEVVSSIKKFGECMRKKGFDLDVPVMSIWDPVFPAKFDNKDGTGIRNTELAVADVTCKREVNLIDIWRKTVTKATDDAYEKNLPVFKDADKYWEELMKYSNKIISTNASDFFN